VGGTKIGRLLALAMEGGIKPPCLDTEALMSVSSAECCFESPIACAEVGSKDSGRSRAMSDCLLQLVHTRTGLESTWASRSLSLEQLSQTTAPHCRQWCFRLNRENEVPQTSQLLLNKFVYREGERRQ
jgi:hypothetical protein